MEPAWASCRQRCAYLGLIGGFICRLFRTWAALHQQHDAGEFLHHCLEYARTEAWLGGWQAHLSHPESVVDSGDLRQAILLHMRGNSLQALIDAWCGQYAVHALLLHSGMIFLPSRSIHCDRR